MISSMDGNEDIAERTKSEIKARCSSCRGIIMPINMFANNALGIPVEYRKSLDCPRYDLPDLIFFENPVFYRFNVYNESYTFDFRTARMMNTGYVLTAYGEFEYGIDRQRRFAFVDSYRDMYEAYRRFAFNMRGSAGSRSELFSETNFRRIAEFIELKCAVLGL